MPPGCGHLSNAICAQAHARACAFTPTRTHTCMHTPIYTHRIITYCFSTATTVMWTCLIFILYIHCLSCKTLFLLSFRAQTVKMKVSVQIPIHLWIIMPMLMIHYDSHGNARSQYATIQVTQTQSQRAVLWWVWMEGRSSWITWQDHELLFQGFHHLYDSATINDLNVKDANFMISGWLKNNWKTEMANSDSVRIHKEN
jgi:hypothetical protein